VNEKLAAYSEVQRFVCPPEFWPALGYTGDARYVGIWWERAGDEASWSDGQSRLVGADWPAYLALMDHNFAPGDPQHWIFGSSDDEATAWLVADRETERAWIVPVKEAQALLAEQHHTKVVVADETVVVAIEEWAALVDGLRFALRPDVVDIDAIEEAMELSAQKYEALISALAARPKRWLPVT